MDGRHQERYEKQTWMKLRSYRIKIPSEKKISREKVWKTIISDLISLLSMTWKSRCCRVGWLHWIAKGNNCKNYP